VNVEGTRNVFEAAKELGIERVVWTSTLLTLSPTLPGQVADEDTVALARYVPDRPLPTGRYFWRVRAVPAGNPPEAWSEVRSFEIRPPDEVIMVECDPDAENHQPAVQAAADRAVALNQQGRSVEIRFAPGVYRVRNTRQFFSIDGATNLVLNGEGAVVHLMDYDMGCGRIVNSRNVLVRGFTIDYPEQQTFLPARVLEVDAAAKKITVEIDPASDTYDEHTSVTAGIYTKGGKTAISATISPMSEHCFAIPSTKAAADCLFIFIFQLPATKGFLIKYSL